MPRRLARKEYTIGIDEVGRGPLAGPVTVAAVLLPRTAYVTRRTSLGRLRDSKKLTQKQREAWHAYFRKHPRVRFAIASVSPRVIDEINIARAANRAARQAFKKLLANYRLRSANCQIYLDGSLYLGERRDRVGEGKRLARYRYLWGDGTLEAHTVIRGDVRLTAIKIASIVAKVHRDRHMCRLAERFPHYGFDKHRGYGTRAHIRSIRKYGPSKVHRLTFIR